MVPSTDTEGMEGVVGLSKSRRRNPDLKRTWKPQPPTELPCAHLEEIRKITFFFRSSVHDEQKGAYEEAERLQFFKR